MTSKNLFLNDFKRYGSALFAWVAVICSLSFLTMSFFRTFTDNQRQFLSVLSIVPAAALKFRGIASTMELFSPLGFYTANNTIFMMLIGSIYSVILGSNILLKEEYAKTAEYLLAKPISRTEVFVTKAAVLILNITILNIAACVFGFISIAIFKTSEFRTSPFFILSFYTLLLNFLFGFFGLFISTLTKKPVPVTVPAIGAVLVLYFIFTISRITEAADSLGYASPFKYVNTSVMSAGYSLELWRVGIFMAVTLLLFIAGLSVYRKKDILL